MKPFLVKEGSWHYKLNEFYCGGYIGYDWKRKHSNFCAYWRATLFKLLLSLTLVGAVLAVVCFLAYQSYLYPAEALRFVGFVLVYLVGAAGLTGLAVGCVTLQEKWQSREENQQEKPKGFFGKKYEAFKSKTCPMVEFKDE